jgi:hypothetical protein
MTSVASLFIHSIVILLLLLIVHIVLFCRPSPSPKGPPLVKEDWPLIGAWAF